MYKNVLKMYKNVQNIHSKVKNVHPKTKNLHSVLLLSVYIITFNNILYFFIKNLKIARSEEKVPLKESEKFDFEIFLVS